MARKSHHPDAGKVRGHIPPRQWLAIRLLLGAAILISLYLGWMSISGRNAVGCGPDSGCQQVLNSRWAYWFGIPVSLLGTSLYAATFGLSMRLSSGHPVEMRRRLWRPMVACGSLILGGAVWFTVLQAVVLGHFCPFCLSAHACASLASILILTRTPLAREPEKAWQKEKELYVPKRAVVPWISGAATGLALLAAGQAVYHPPRFREGVVAGGSATSTNQATARVMELFGGQVQLLLNEVPMLGSPEAPYVMVELHDFTCSHCRSMYLPVKTLQHAFSNELAVASLPMPLDGACNPHVRMTPSPHTNACQYARMSLAIWRAKPDALESFCDWIFTPLNPPPIDQALAYARELVGAANLDKAMADPWVEEYLQKSLTIYGLNLKLNGSGSMPQFIIGTNAVFGQLALNGLFQRVTNQFPLHWPPKS